MYIHWSTIHLSRPMGKPTICIGVNKGADQLRGNREADQRLCFRYTDSTIPLLPKQNFKLLALFCACTSQFVSDLFGNHIVGFPTRRLIFFSVKRFVSFPPLQNITQRLCDKSHRIRKPTICILLQGAD